MLSMWRLLLFMYDATMTHQLEKYWKFIALKFPLCLLPTQTFKHVIKTIILWNKGLHTHVQQIYSPFEPNMLSLAVVNPKVHPLCWEYHLPKDSDSICNLLERTAPYTQFHVNSLGDIGEATAIITVIRYTMFELNPFQVAFSYTL